MNTDLIERIIFLLVIAILLIAVVKYKLAIYKKKRNLKKRFARGNLLESQARKFLESRGFQVIAEQKIYFHKYTVNGSNQESKLIPDYLVKKDGKTYIVEVKSGKSAIQLKDKNTRRQLLEYDFVIENDGVFLLDMENKNLQLVSFHSKKKISEEKLNRLIIVITVIGLLVPFTFWKVKIFLGLLLFIGWKYPTFLKSFLFRS